MIFTSIQICLLFLAVYTTKDLLQFSLPFVLIIPDTDTICDIKINTCKPHEAKFTVQEFVTDYICQLDENFRIISNEAGSVKKESDYRFVEVDITFDFDVYYPVDFYLELIISNSTPILIGPFKFVNQKTVVTVSFDGIDKDIKSCKDLFLKNEENCYPIIISSEMLSTWNGIVQSPMFDSTSLKRTDRWKVVQKYFRKTNGIHTMAQIKNNQTDEIDIQDLHNNIQQNAIGFRGPFTCFFDAVRLDIRKRREKHKYIDRKLSQQEINNNLCEDSNLCYKTYQPENNERSGNTFQYESLARLKLFSLIKSQKKIEKQKKDRKNQDENSKEKNIDNIIEVDRNKKECGHDISSRNKKIVSKTRKKDKPTESKRPTCKDTFKNNINAILESKPAQKPTTKMENIKTTRTNSEDTSQDSLHEEKKNGKGTLPMLYKTKDKYVYLILICFTIVSCGVFMIFICVRLLKYKQEMLPL